MTLEDRSPPQKTPSRELRPRAEMYGPALWQLVVWMTGCAVYFAMARHFLPRPPSQPLQFVILFALAMGHGLCWLGLIAVLRIGPAARLGPTEPGTWLLAVIGLILAAQLAFEAGSADPPAQRTFGQAAILATSSLVFVIPTLARRMPRHWSAFFMVLAIAECVRLGTSLMQVTAWRIPNWVTSLTSPLARAIIALTAIGISLFYDQMTPVRRSWLHWSGVVCGTLYFLFTVVHQVG